MINFWTDEGEEDSEEAGPAKKEEQTQESNQADGQNNGPLEASPSSEGEERAEEEESSSEPDRASSTEEGQSACGSTDTNSQDANDGDQSAGAEPAGKEEEDEEEEEEEDGEGAATCAQANKRVPGRRHYTERRKKALFTIQAVNSNGTTERGMTEAGSSFSFSCEYTNEKLNLLQTSLLLMPLYNFRVMCAQATVITKWDYILFIRLLNSHLFKVEERLSWCLLNQRIHKCKCSFSKWRDSLFLFSSAIHCHRLGPWYKEEVLQWEWSRGKIANELFDP